MNETGILNIFKPVGMTSHDAVAYVRRQLGGIKSGHAGTLDPAACGVLVMLLGGATKLSQRATELAKTCRTEMVFGIRMDTGDAQGKLLAATPSTVVADELADNLARFKGVIQQVPPMTSAVKVGGRKLYQLAHKGLEIERPPRTITIHGLKLVDFISHPLHPRALLDIVCSSGTYVRTLVEDIAASLGEVAATSFLMRTAVGPFTSAQAVQLKDITAEKLASLLLPVDFLDNRR
jgi:tRNA pseudouridine55 synthase